MALPPGIVPKSVTIGIASFFDGTLAEGTATITAPSNVVHTPTNRPIFSSQISKRFIDGEATFNLCPTDAAGLNNVSWTYKLNVVISGALVQPEPVYFLLPEAGPSAVDLDGLVTVPSSAGTPISVDALTTAEVDPLVATYVGDDTSQTGVALRAAFVPVWKPAETVDAGVHRLSPDGTIIRRTTAGTTGAAWDATEQAEWTVTAGAGASSYTDEQVRDVIGTALVAGTGVTITPDDAADTITITAAGGDGTVTSADITDATTVGRSVLTAADAATARTAIGAGTSSLTVGTTAGTAAEGNDPRLSDARTPTAHTHPASDLTATGTRDATTFLRGDNTWAAPAGGSTDPEVVRDTIATALVAGANVTITPDDVADTITIAATDTNTTDPEVVRDTVAAQLVAGANVTLTPDDAANTLTIASSGGTGITAGTEIGQIPVWDGDSYEPQAPTEVNAAGVPFTPAGTIAATNVQAAIEEVAAEAGGASGGFHPAAVSGLKSWTADPAGVANAQNSALTAGVVRLDRIAMAAAGSFSEVIFNVGSAGSGLTAGQCFVGIYRSDGTLAASVAAETVFAASGVPRVALGSAVSYAAGELLYVAFLANGSTMPGLAHLTVGNSALVDLGQTDFNRRAGVSGTGQTALPATLTTITGTNRLLWAGVA